jgi:hypothetical protein
MRNSRNFKRRRRCSDDSDSSDDEDSEADESQIEAINNTTIYFYAEFSRKTVFKFNKLLH